MHWGSCDWYYLQSRVQWQANCLRVMASKGTVKQSERPLKPHWDSQNSGRNWSRIYYKTCTLYSFCFVWFCLWCPLVMDSHGWFIHILRVATGSGGIYIYVETYPHVRSNLLHLVPVRPSSVSLPRGFRQKWDGKRRIAKCHYSTTKRCYESCSYIDLGLTNQPLVWMYICCLIKTVHGYTWWRHQMETFSALLAICAGNSPTTGEFPTQMPVTRSFDVFFDLCLE